jgi:hypothetical protein
MIYDTPMERLDPHAQCHYETAYRRGLHHGLVLASDLVENSTTLVGARRLLREAEGVASEYRSQSRHPGRPPLADVIRERLRRGSP